MIIPSKFNGFHNGVRRCFGGGGGGGSAEVAAPSTPVPPANTAGTSTIPSNNLNLRNMGGMRYDQAGPQYNALLQQGYTGNDIRGALTTNGRPVSDSDYGFLVQNAGMTSPTGRPMAGSDQFFQPVYNTSYQNYANPLTAFNTSTYGTTPARSNASQWWQGQGATDQQYMDRLRSQAPSYQNMNIGDLAQNMQQFGISPSDMQAAGSYGGSTYGGFNPGISMPQMQTPFNPYTNSSGYGGFGGGFGGMGGYGGFGQSMQTQTPFSFQQPSYQPQMQMQTPFSYQQQSYQPSYQSSYGGYGDYGYSAPMQSSYQQPMTPPPPQRTSSGPTTPIVGRSAGFRGTPNVMRRAEGGIASLMDDVE